MIWLYRLLFLPALLLIGPRYLWRMRQRGGYGASVRGRLGGIVAPPRKPGVRRVWIQAVSVGEVLAAEPLVRRLHAAGVEVILTTTTTTGMAVARERLAALTVALDYFPLDFLPFVLRAWDRVRPDVAVLLETELWPEHLHRGRRRGVPVVVVNARLSDRSLRRMLRVRALAAWLVRGPARILAQSEEDAARFVALGADGVRVTNAGNLKFDVDVGAPLEPAERAALRRACGLGDAPVIVGASTWPGEEEALIAALRAARAAGIAARLLLVPRHAERRGEVLRALEGQALAIHLRSRGEARGDVDVCLADTTGELRRLVQVGDVVFVGKSLPPHTEGQTPLEAAAFGRAVVLGPGMANFRAAVAGLLERGAGVQVADAAALPEAVIGLLRDPARRAALGAAGQAWHQTNRGALQRTVEVLLQAAERRG